MAPRSRTGKFIQGLFGRSKQPATSEASQNYRPRERSADPEFDASIYPSVARFDDDEETNWDDVETAENENNPLVRPQQPVPAITPPTSPTIPDPEDWDEALPAATVKNSNIQAARRIKVTAQPLNDDVWDDDASELSFSTANPPPSEPTADPTSQAIGLWTATVGQVSRLLPNSLRRFAVPILTAIVVALVTVTIWFIDGFTLPGSNSVATAPVANQSGQPNPAIPQVSPEQTFIEAIQTQFAELTSQYPEHLVQSLAIDFQHDRAIVQLDPIWYTLDAERQDALIERMWDQTQTNQFTQLEIQDTDGKTIARSPVVGKQMIVLQRQQS